MSTVIDQPRQFRPLVWVRVFCLLVLALPARHVSAQARKATLEELTLASTAVVLGKTTQTTSYWNERGTKIFTDVTIQVEEAVTGSVANETVITIPGGRVGNTVYEVSDMPVFEEGEEVLVFLWQHPSGQHLVTGGTQGKMPVVDDGEQRRRVVPAGSLLMQVEDSSGSPSLTTEGKTSLDDLIQRVKSFKNN